MTHHTIRKHDLILQIQRNGNKNDTGKQAVGILLDKALHKKRHRRKTGVLTAMAFLYNKI
jgi:hypothetical protein